MFENDAAGRVSLAPNGEINILAVVRTCIALTREREPYRDNLQLHRSYPQLGSGVCLNEEIGPLLQTVHDVREVVNANQ